MQPAFKKIYGKSGFVVKSYISAREMIFDFSKLLKSIPKNSKKITEVGCGYGLLSFLMAEKFKNAQIYSSDLDKRRISELKKINQFKNLHFTCENAVNAKIDSDVVIFVDLLHHISYESQHKLLTNIYRNTPKNVLVIVKDMDKGKYSIKQWFNRFIDLVSSRQCPLFYREKASFIELFEYNGFKVVKTEYLNKPFIPLSHILFLLKKK